MQPTPTQRFEEAPEVPTVPPIEGANGDDLSEESEYQEDNRDSEDEIAIEDDRNFLQRTGDFVQERPVAAIVGAFVMGWLVARTRMRSKSANQ